MDDGTSASLSEPYLGNAILLANRHHGFDRPDWLIDHHSRKVEPCSTVVMFETSRGVSQAAENSDREQ